MTPDHSARESTDRLIAELTSDASPVQPLRAPWRRALLWILIWGAVAATLIWRYADLGRFVGRLQDLRTAVQCVAALLTGLIAIVAAFELSIPGSSERWRLAPLPALLVWIAVSGLGCLQPGIAHNGLSLAQAGRECLPFLLIVSVPGAIFLFWWLRRARPIAPLTVAVMAALGVAALAAFLLEFFHPYDVTVIDLAVHLVAVALLVLGGATLGRAALDSASDHPR